MLSCHYAFDKGSSRTEISGPLIIKYVLIFLKSLLIVIKGIKLRRHPPQNSKYWMPIHYDTIEDGQNKKSYFLFSFLIRIVIFAFYRRDLYVKNSVTPFHWRHLNILYPL